jgi:hypothetical protein
LNPPSPPRWLRCAYEQRRAEGHAAARNDGHALNPNRRLLTALERTPDRRRGQCADRGQGKSWA